LAQLCVFGIFSFVGQDGKSNWLEGLPQIALHVMPTILFYALPVSELGAD